MKFLSFALAGVLAQATNAAKTISGNEFDSLLRSGKVDAKTLLRNSVPYEQGMRKMEDEDEDEDEATEDTDADQQQSYGYLGAQGITGEHSVKFNKCISVTVEEDWDNYEDETLLQYVKEGSIKSVRSYVLFNVCETRTDCVNGQQDTDNTYMVELATFVNAMLNYLPDQKDDYCEGCENQQSYCETVYATGYTSTTNIDYSTANFFYGDEKYQLIDCTQCSTFGCFNDEDVYDENGWDDVSGWVQTIGACYETGVQWYDSYLSAGWMCNEEGTGMEIAVFADEECKLYNPLKQYRSLIEDGGDDWAYYAKSSSVISYLFSGNAVDCYGGDIVYVNMFQQVYYDEGDWDPCQLDSYGYYLNQEQCEEMLDENPCYAAYGEEIEDQDECDGFMEEYPCWAMPGTEVSEDYQEACEEYQAENSIQANNACAYLFNGSGDNDNDNDGGDGDGDRDDGDEYFEPTALSTCVNYVAEDQEQEADEEDEDGEQNENEDWGLEYDVYQDDAENNAAICYHVEELYISGSLSSNIFTNVYNSDSSGTLYDYSDETVDATEDEGSDSGSSSGSGSSSFFPTLNISSVKAPAKMHPAAIAATALLVAGAVFLALFGVGRIVKSNRRSKNGMDASPRKDTPLLV